jgi:ABC-2 type transport system ATP-binding protein
MSAVVIEAHGLSKRYGRQMAVDGVDLTVAEGEVVGLLGPNGAGKSTTILMLLGLTEASGGTVRILGRDPWREPLAVKREVGYLPDAVGFYDNLSGRENLRYTARLGGLAPAETEARMAETLGRVRLDDVADRRVGTYSRGMRQRLGLAELLMRRCKVAILDEPTSGLDPQSTHDLLQLIGGFAHDGMTVLVSSHLLDIVQSICTRVALFNRGKIGFVGTVAELSSRVADSGLRIDLAADGIDIAKVVAGLEGVRVLEAGGEGRWQLEAPADIRPDLARRIVEQGGALRSLDAHRLALGEAYTRYFEEAGHEA